MNDTSVGGIPYSELGLQQKEAEESAKSVLGKEFFAERDKHRHACYSRFSPLKGNNNCGCFCGRHYFDDKTIILELGGKYTPECSCTKRGVPDD